jgi:hypothetical protein|eukprot:COSAG01_NODE_3592_length_5899_cov_32.421897_5_plen_122_part_00
MAIFGPISSTDVRIVSADSSIVAGGLRWCAARCAGMLLMWQSLRPCPALSPFHLEGGESRWVYEGAREVLSGQDYGSKAYYEGKTTGPRRTTTYFWTSLRKGTTHPTVCSGMVKYSRAHFH